MKKTKYAVKQFRNFNDFEFGSFTSYVTENQIIIRGIDKKKKCVSKYLEINRNE
jgi:hypothetical protein